MWLILFIASSLLSCSLGADENPCSPNPNAGRYDYEQALCMSILFYEAERSGELPSDMRFSWRGNSALGDGGDVGLDLTGGYFDAGDHVKFGFPMAGTVTVLAWSLLSYTSAYELTGQVQYAEAAIRWGTDYFLKAHAGDFLFYAQVGDGETDHVYWGRPEEMTMSRPSLSLDADKPGSDVCGETAAALAAASIVFADNDPEYSATLLASAMELFDFADLYRGTYSDSLPETQGFYTSSGYGDELAWSAIWLYKATGDQVYADKAREFWTEFSLATDPNTLSWDSKTAGVKVLMAEEFQEAEYLNAVQENTAAVRASQHTASGLVFLDKWGSLRHAMNAALVAFRAADLGLDIELNRGWAAQQVNYVLGSTGRSFIVGFGQDPPTRPHHRSSSCPDEPEVCDGGWALNQDGPNPQVLYGALVGGPDAFDGYVDDRNDYVHNEVACDYNAALTGALAAMITLS